MNKQAISIVVLTGVAVGMLAFAVVEHSVDASTIAAKNRQLAGAESKVRSAQAQAAKAPVTQVTTQYVYGHSTLVGVYASGMITSGALGTYGNTPDDQTCSSEYSMFADDTRLKVTLDRPTFMQACETNMEDTANQDSSAK